MKIKAAAAALIGMVASEGAFADWQYTSWGMSEQEVLAAGGDRLAPDGPASDDVFEGYENGASGIYQSGSYSFDASFHFKRSGLALVHLDMTDSSAQACIDLRQSLEGIYGDPYQRTDNSFIFAQSWRSDSENNRIDFMHFQASDSCNVNYKPLRDASASGL